jgi:hypothetical protein
MGAIGFALGPELRARGTKPFNTSALFAGGAQGAWYDPSDLGSMFQDSAGTIGAALDQPVGLIRDKSGRGNDARQATAAARPVLRQDSGRLYLDFDGVDDLMASAATVTLPMAGFFAAALRKANETTSNRFFAIAGSASPTLGHWLHNVSSGGRVQANCRNSAGGPYVALSASSSVPVGGDRLVDSAFGAQIDVAVNGVVSQSSSVAAAAAVTGCAIAINGNSHVAPSTTPCRFYGGVLLCAAIDPASRAKLRRWLAAKAGIAI